MRQYLIELNVVVDKSDGKLKPEQTKRWHEKYHRIVKKAQIECPPPTDNRLKGTHGRLKRSKS